MPKLQSGYETHSAGHVNRVILALSTLAPKQKEVDMATPIEIPKVLLKRFVENPRIVMEEKAPGYWPIDFKYLKGSDFFDELLRDEEFAKTHQVVIMKR